MEKLETGDLFLKHHKWGSCKLRKIWVDANLEYLYWGEMNTVF
jgi:hypothetical protein